MSKPITNVSRRKKRIASLYPRSVDPISTNTSPESSVKPVFLIIQGASTSESIGFDIILFNVTLASTISEISVMREVSRSYVRRRDKSMSCLSWTTVNLSIRERLNTFCLPGSN